VLKVYDSDIFKGASVESDVHNGETLQSLSVVSQTWQSKKLFLTAPAAQPQPPGGPASSGPSVHSMTGVDKLHAAGIRGKGAKVGVVDTGVQYTHPAVRNSHGSSTLVHPQSWLIINSLVEDLDTDSRLLGVMTSLETVSAGP
jgi:subtilisin family serine protease